MDNKLTETGSSNRRVAAVPIWIKRLFDDRRSGRVYGNRQG